MQLFTRKENDFGLLFTFTGISALETIQESSKRGEASSMAYG